MIITAAPVILAITAGVLTRRVRYAALFVVAYLALLGVALYRAWSLGIEVTQFIAPLFWPVGHAVQLQIEQQGYTPSDIADLVSEAFKIYATNMWIAGSEEGLGRAPIPLAGPLVPTLLFIALHIPTRVAAFLSPDFLSIVPVPELGAVMAISVIAVIALAAVFLIRSYAHAGLLGSILTHAFYNTYLTLYAIEPIAALTLLTVMAIVYIALRWREIVKEGKAEEVPEIRL
jgi:hypothetical protein